VLGLRAAGLGTTLSPVLVPVEAEVERLLRIPDGVAVAAHLGVGWPAGTLPTRLTRRPVADFTTVDSFDGEAFQPGHGGPGQRLRDQVAARRDPEHRMPQRGADRLGKPAARRLSPMTAHVRIYGWSSSEALPRTAEVNGPGWKTAAGWCILTPLTRVWRVGWGCGL
jgi:hypothetical protein